MTAVKNCFVIDFEPIFYTKGTLWNSKYDSSNLYNILNTTKCAGLVKEYYNHINLDKPEFVINSSSYSIMMHHIMESKKELRYFIDKVVIVDEGDYVKLFRQNGRTGKYYMIFWPNYKNWGNVAIPFLGGNQNFNQYAKNICLKMMCIDYYTTHLDFPAHVSKTLGIDVPVGWYNRPSSYLAVLENINEPSQFSACEPSNHINSQINTNPDARAEIWVNKFRDVHNYITKFQTATSISDSNTINQNFLGGSNFAADRNRVSKISKHTASQYVLLPFHHA